jgi:aspartyl protease family protein
MPQLSLPFPPQVIGLIVAAAVVLLLLVRIPYVGAAIRLLFSAALLAILFIVIAERAPFDPSLSRVTGGLALDGQEVVGNEVRIRMADDGHFWAKLTIDGYRRRMLIDSGATVTALSQRTALAAGLKPRDELMPVLLRTANGTVPARTASVGDLRLGAIEARNLKVVVSPAFGDMDVLGMNFLSKLKSWRVEERTLILVPHHPQPQAAT